MTMNSKPALYVYNADGDEMMSTATVKDDTHIPREGEYLTITDHSDDGAQTVGFTGGRVCVTDVSTEFRLVDNVGRGQSWQQIIAVTVAADAEQNNVRSAGESRETGQPIKESDGDAPAAETAPHRTKNEEDN